MGVIAFMNLTFPVNYPSYGLTAQDGLYGFK